MTFVKRDETDFEASDCEAHPLMSHARKGFEPESRHHPLLFVRAGEFSRNASHVWMRRCIFVATRPRPISHSLSVFKDEIFAFVEQSFVHNSRLVRTMSKWCIKARHLMACRVLPIFIRLLPPSSATESIASTTICDGPHHH